MIEDLSDKLDAQGNLVLEEEEESEEELEEMEKVSGLGSVAGRVRDAVSGLASDVSDVSGKVWKVGSKVLWVGVTIALTVFLPVALVQASAQTEQEKKSNEAYGIEFADSNNSGPGSS